MTAVPEGGEFDFDAETRLLPGSADGTFQVEISDRWSGIASVNGGFLMANCLKALDAVLPFPDPITVSGLYLRPGNAGRTVITTELLRSGRTTAFGQASLFQGGKEALRVTAAFADLSAVTPVYTGITPPKLPDPSECERLTGLGGITLGRRFEYRGTAQPGWLSGQPSGEPFAEFWIRFADGRPVDTLTLPFIVDAAPPAVLELGAGSTTIELTVHVRARPAPGWLACRSYTRFVSGGYHEEDFEVWDCTGMLVAQSRQLALVRPFDSLALAARAAAGYDSRPPRRCRWIARSLLRRRCRYAACSQASICRRPRSPSSRRGLPSCACPTSRQRHCRRRRHTRCSHRGACSTTARTPDSSRSARTTRPRLGFPVAGGDAWVGSATSNIAQVEARYTDGRVVRDSVFTIPGTSIRLWALGLPGPERLGSPLPGVSLVVRDIHGFVGRGTLSASLPNPFPFEVDGTATHLFTFGVQDLGALTFQGKYAVFGYQAPTGLATHLTQREPDFYAVQQAYPLPASQPLQGQFGADPDFLHPWWFGVARADVAKIVVRLADGPTMQATCPSPAPAAPPGRKPAVTPLTATCTALPGAPGRARVFAIQLPQDPYRQQTIPQGTATAYNAAGEALATISLGTDWHP